MAKLNQIIDFELLWKKIHDELTEEQELILTNWLNANVLHRKYFENVKSYYSKGSKIQYSESELKKALHKIHLRTKIRSNYRRNTLIVTVTGIAASILLLLYFQFNIQSPNSNFQVFEQAQTIQHGSKKAILILADGTEHDLSTENADIIDSYGNKILNSGNKLEYNNATGNKNELKYNTIKIPRGGEYFVILSDCTKVWLNSETTLTFPVHFASDVRSVELSGEAYFEVRKYNNKPFVVKSGEQSITVLGTEFNVSSYNDYKTIYTTLVEGVVEVSISTIPNDKHILKPNEQLSFDKSENRLIKKLVDVNEFIAWKDGRFVFYDQRLDQIMNTLSKWYDVEIKFEKEEIKKLRFTGNLERYSDITNILAKIERTNEVKFEITNKTILIN